MKLFCRAIWRMCNTRTSEVTTGSHTQHRTLLLVQKEHVMFLRWKSKKLREDGYSGEDSTTFSGSPEITSFQEMMERKRREARKSIVVQLQKKQFSSELYSYCSQYGSVKSMQHYILDKRHYFIVEFVEESDVGSVLHTARYLNTNRNTPVRSTFLRFQRERGKMYKSCQSNIPLIEIGENNAPSKNSLFYLMQMAESVSDQMRILHDATSLSGFGSRLRFLTARQIEFALGSLFPKIRAFPFGSSVNGFGNRNCDLDLVLELDDEVANSDVFHAKNSMLKGRTQMQRHLKIIGDVLQVFLPGCVNVRRILQARVPIIKYRQEFAGVECDLSITNTSAVMMAEFLFVLGYMDERVRPLVHAVRTWARDVGLTKPAPGHWITNFSLTLLVLFYLQQPLPSPVLPTLNQIMSIATNENDKNTVHGVNCNFLRDPEKLQKLLGNQRKNTDDLGELLLKFFEFYCKFDFISRAISLRTGAAVPKPEHAALYIENPLAQDLNVSKNVSPEQVERLRTTFRNAAWALDTNFTRPSNSSNSWGLIDICQSRKKGQSAKMKNSQRSKTFPHPTKNIPKDRAAKFSKSL